MKPILYIHYYGSLPLTTVISSLSPHFSLHILNLYDESLSFRYQGVSVIDGKCIRNLQELGAFLVSISTRYQVLITFSELLTEIVAKVSKELGMPYGGDKVISHSRDKLLMRNIWNGVGQFKYQKISSFEDLCKVSSSGILKPRKSTGSIGFSKFSIDQISDKSWYNSFVSSLKESFSFDRFGLLVPDLIYEQVIEESPEEWYKSSEYSGVCSIEGIVVKGKFTSHCVMGQLKHFKDEVSFGTVFPSGLSAGGVEIINNYVKKKIEKIGYETAIIHAEVILGKKGYLEMLEVATRPGGRANQNLLQRTCGINPLLEYVYALLNLPYNPSSLSSLRVLNGASLAIMPVDFEGNLLPIEESKYIDIESGVSFIFKNVSSVVELIQTKFKGKVERKNINKISSASVYGLLLLTNKSHEDLIKDTKYIRNNLGFFFQKKAS